MQNVGTAYAVKRAVIDGEPITRACRNPDWRSNRSPGQRLGTAGDASASFIE
ncbi:hypothetical protein ACLB1R_08730 [Escherichia coli]